MRVRVKVPLKVRVTVEVDSEGVVKYADADVDKAALMELVATTFDTPTRRAWYTKQTRPRLDEGLVRVHYRERVLYVKYLRSTKLHITLTQGEKPTEQKWDRKRGLPPGQHVMFADRGDLNRDDLAALNERAAA